LDEKRIFCLLKVSGIVLQQSIESWENAMSRRRISQYVLFPFLLSLLAACQPINQVSSRQKVIDWPEQRLVFVADGWSGRVRSFLFGNGAPVLFAQTKSIQRASVRDLRLDSSRGQLWVLGDNAVFLHDARSLGLQKRFPLELKVSALRIDADCVKLLDAAGETIGQVDSQTLMVSWLLPEDRRG
jgi:hypothetical protein